jgi:hypothetical protein
MNAQVISIAIPDDPKDIIIPKIKENTAKFYRIESSKRLSKILVNPNQRDVKATVGTYSPHSFESKPKGIKWDMNKSKFRVNPDEKIGPGLYTWSSPAPKIIKSSFTSTTKRFANVRSTDVAPGSYDIDTKPVSLVWKPWVAKVSSRLGRLMDKYEKNTVPGTVSQRVYDLSQDTSKSQFLGTKLSIETQVKQPQEDNLRPTLNLDARHISTNPYGESLLVQSISVPFHLPPLP